VSSTQAAVAVIVSIVQGLAPSQDILPAIERLVGMIGGIVVVIVAQAAAGPLVARAIAAILGSGRYAMRDPRRSSEGSDGEFRAEEISRKGRPMDTTNGARSGEAGERTDLPRIVVRNSRDTDVPGMLAIYLHHIRRGVDPGIDGEFEAPDAEDLKRRRRSMNNRKMPHLVAEEAGIVVGYSYAVPFRKRPAYRYTVKHSIYVRSDRLHAGIGRQLMTALIDACAAAGFRQMIGYIDGANVASIKLHESFGFRQVGYLPAVGYKFGRWTDSIMMQRSLGPGATEPPTA
jgi:L-amino acid N-acyltransferase YncA